MKRVTLRLPERTVTRIDSLVDLGLYPSRSEAIRSAIRESDDLGVQTDDRPYTTGGSRL